VVTRWTKRHLGTRLTSHKLRHAYGRQCVDLGVDIRVIAEALGHESLESTKTYTQVSFQRTRRIAELFCSLGESNSPGQNAQQTQPFHAGLNLQK
jgi:site-specific recombinase XerD